MPRYKIVNGEAVEMTADEVEALEARAAADEARRIAELPAKVNAERDRRIAAGMAVTVSVGTFNVQTDPKSREIIAGLSQVGLIRNVSSDTTTTIFRDADNIEWTLTPADLVSMGMQVAAMVDSVYKASWTIKARPDLADIDIADDQYWTGA